MKNPFAGRERRLVTVGIDRIVPNPNQPRRHFAREELEALSESILQNGLLQPLTVRRAEGGTYELVAGERRLRACRMAGLHALPCIVMELNNQQSSVLALVENLQRSDLDFFEEAEAIGRLIGEYDLTQEEVAARLGRKQSTIANKLRLLRLTQDERRKILEAGLTERHARALLRLPEGALRTQTLARIIQGRLNVSATEALVERTLVLAEAEKAPVRRRPLGIVKDVRLLVNTLNRAVESIQHTGIAVCTRQEDRGDFVEYIVQIPKARAAAPSPMLARR